jgi:hypothetical protein
MVEYIQRPIQAIQVRVTGGNCLKSAVATARAGKYRRWGGDLKTIRLFCVALALAAMLTAASQAQEAASEREQSRAGTASSVLNDVSLSQNQVPQNQDPPRKDTNTDGQSSLPDAPKPATGPSTPTNRDEEYGKQNKRILWVIPNYRAVSANTHLPPLNFKSELWLATQDTFDYSDFILVGALAGINMAGKSQPTFGQGAEGFGKYYWHAFVDGAVENYMTEAIVPVVTKEDPRYYTMGQGGLFKRTGYAVSRLFITRTNSGTSTFNLSEVVGAGAAAGIGNAYYPAQNNQWVKTYQRWGTQVGLDGVFNVLKEFWPDVNQAIFHGKY